MTVEEVIDLEMIAKKEIRTKLESAGLEFDGDFGLSIKMTSLLNLKTVDGENAISDNQKRWMKKTYNTKSFRQGTNGCDVIDGIYVCKAAAKFSRMRDCKAILDLYHYYYAMERIRDNMTSEEILLMNESLVRCVQMSEEKASVYKRASERLLSENVELNSKIIDMQREVARLEGKENGFWDSIPNNTLLAFLEAAKKCEDYETYGNLSVLLYQNQQRRG